VSISDRVGLLNCVNVQTLQPYHRLHVPLKRVKFPKPAGVQ